MSRGKVLIIDDEARIRSLLELYLVENDYEVFTGHDGTSGLKAVEQHRPDLIVLDILLPDRNGLEICQQIRQYGDIPIVYLSCLQESETIIEGLELGGDDYLTKPFDPNVLVAKVNALLRRSGDWRDPETRIADSDIEGLTEQELQILQWIEKGLTNKEIAGALDLKESTIKVYNHVLFQKLQVKNRTQAIVKAKEERLL